MFQLLAGYRLNIYCVLCRAGAEMDVKQRIEKYTELEALVAIRVMEEKKGKQWRMVERPLLPGYVFLFSKEELPFGLVAMFNNLYRILQYEQGQRNLQGDDREYASWLYRHDGMIRQSTIFEEGGKIKVIEGPLLDASGTIHRIDKRHRRAWVKFNFAGEERIVSLSANCLASLPKQES